MVSYALTPYRHNPIKGVSIRLWEVIDGVVEFKEVFISDATFLGKPTNKNMSYFYGDGLSYLPLVGLPLESYSRILRYMTLDIRREK